ncbi:MAG: YceI family protein, partial [Rhodocyclaceae bacterium]|nr:YceI family protein [Rhodocyclaceae bacterium]
RGARVLRIDETRSLVAVTVRRGGALARLGHDHIVASHKLAGRIAPDAGRADLYLDLEQMSVDEPALRAEAGLDPVVAESAIAGTRRNMLEKVLDAARHPRVFLQARRAPAGDGSWDLAIRLNGAEHTYRVAVQLHELPDGQGASGEFVLRQSDFGITPFAVLGGALRVEDELALRFRIVAQTY